ncbi:MarR family winged helix-turn-helix transcriptional regulator [Tardiphaga alba]|uniref:MarR family winged helix-turn-helix transcriptional regulator n=1 Tax=Tardiphaga alba TaxID=340268 RepID=UPI001BADD5C6|nr:MarR family winged helix-turn-helix transcriptional regulator [Tardiphaga alba]
MAKPAGRRTSSANKSPAKGETSKVSGGKKPAGHLARQAALTASRPELLVDGSDAEFRRLVHSLFGFLVRHQTLREGHAAVIGLAGIEFTTLISIRHLSAQGDVHVRAVADHLHLSGAFVTTVTNKLETKGLITKTSHPGDRRRISLVVTSHGAELLERLAPTQQQINDVQFGCLSAKEFRQLLDMVQRLVESSDRAIALQRYLAEAKVKALSPEAQQVVAARPVKSRKA